MKRDLTQLLYILECFDRIELYTQGGRDEFLSSTRDQDAVIRNFQIVGDAAKLISAETKRLAPEFPGSQGAKFRDVLVHRYVDVDFELVWRRVELDLPGLRQQVQNLVRQLRS